jgi:hypothetical protein
LILATSTVEDQNLSFGIDGVDIPGSGTSLSFGDVTPSAAKFRSPRASL